MADMCGESCVKTTTAEQWNSDPNTIILKTDILWVNNVNSYN